MIEHIPAQYLPYKFEHEIHANEVAILPYYIANLNIEYTYQQKIGEYKEFKNICFVDTLDNTAALNYKHKQEMMFGISSENAARIKNQNERKISVIIGNPPYNAKQANYNFQNSNRAYKEIDRRIKDTYIKHGTAQNQIVVYDMFTRFYRWAMDRIDENGVIAFITNRSFIDGRAFDGFRKSLEDDFDAAYIVDLRSDVRANPKIAGTTHNVFGIQTGVAVMFLVRKQTKAKAKYKCRIEYVSLDDFWRKEKKLEWLCENPLREIAFERIGHDDKHNWINQSDNDWDSLLPLIDKKVKGGKSEQAVFKLFSRGVGTYKDEWVYDFDKTEVQRKMSYFVKIYQQTLRNKNFADKMRIKWDEDLESYLNRGVEKEFDIKKIVEGLYRPFTKMYFYFDKHFIGRTYQWLDIYNEENQQVIVIPGIASPKKFHTISIDQIIDMNCLPAGCQCLPLYRYDANGEQHDNITDWGLQQFHEHYNDKSIKREDIFHYTYAVLHHPAYRRKYELNLKREFPRLPFYEDFRQWVAWGKELMILHINYETAKPFKLKRVDAHTNSTPRPKLKADKTGGTIELDSETVLQSVPPAAWEYKLGNRSALEWILDQYKEKKPSDATIAEKFNTYRFADYKETVIDLLKRVCTVSIRTVEITNQMPN